MRVPAFAAAVLVLALTPVLAEAPPTMPWKADAPVADGWHMIETSSRPADVVAGRGATEGAARGEAPFLTGTGNYARVLERHISVTALRGTRQRVVIRLKQEDEARGWASFTVNYTDGSRWVSRQAIRNDTRVGVWQEQVFVLNIPSQASDLVIRTGFTGHGTLWIGSVALQRVGGDVRLNAMNFIRPPVGGTDASPPATVPPGSGAVTVGGNWHTKNGFRGAAVSLLMGTAARIKLNADGNSLSGDATIYTDNKGAEPQLSFNRYGGLENDIPLESWRGKRIRVTLRLKDEDGARAFAIAQVNRVDGDGRITLAQRNSLDGRGWETHQFVMDVPDDGNHLYVYAGFTGKGRMQVDGVTLETVSMATPLSPAMPVGSGGPMNCICGDLGNTSYFINGNVAQNWGYSPPPSQALSDPPRR